MTDVKLGFLLWPQTASWHALRQAFNATFAFSAST